MQRPGRTGAATPNGTCKQPTSAAEVAAPGYLNVGSFRFWFTGERWEWSDEVARMHGYKPGSVVPTTKLLLSHKHPDDRAHVRDLLDHALHSGESFSSRHRFIDTAGGVHDAIVVADRILDEAGAVVGTAGYYIDLTETFDEARSETRQEVLDEALPDLFENRAAIEQAKGVLIAVIGSVRTRRFVCCSGGRKRPTSSCVRWPGNSSTRSSTCHPHRLPCRASSTTCC